MKTCGFSPLSEHNTIHCTTEYTILIMATAAGGAGGAETAPVIVWSFKIVFRIFVLFAFLRISSPGNGNAWKWIRSDVGGRKQTTDVLHKKYYHRRAIVSNNTSKYHTELNAPPPFRRHRGQEEELLACSTFSTLFSYAFTATVARTMSSHNLTQPESVK